MGIWVDFYISPEAGGGYSYCESLLNGINNFDFNSNLEIVNLTVNSGEYQPFNLKKETIPLGGNHKVAGKGKLGLTKNSSIYHGLAKIKSSLYHKIKNKLLNKRKLNNPNQADSKIIDQLLENKIDIIFYITPQEKIIDFPFISVHWDAGHRSTFPFPETSSELNFSKREFYFRNILSRATMILCESDAGAGELFEYFSYFKSKVDVMPIFAGDVINLVVSDKEQNSILDKYSLKKQAYFFYPAQFWALKNHYNLLIGFKKFIEVNSSLGIKLVLTGSDKGNLDYIKSIINSLDLKQHVVLPGFVENDEILTFYLNATCLVFPAFLGPTNMPLIEAAELKCPIICSDLKGHHEILKENALYFDPANSNEIFNSMEKMLDHKLRYDLSLSAYQHIKTSKFNVKKSILKLEEILLKVKPIRETYK